jgi:hypothetical protein
LPDGLWLSGSAVKINEKYVLFAANDQKNLSIRREPFSGGCVGGIEGTISAVGMNKNHIAALQNPRNNPAISNYWHIDLKVTHSEFKGITGPLTKEAFETVTHSQMCRY